MTVNCLKAESAQMLFDFLADSLTTLLDWFVSPFVFNREASPTRQIQHSKQLPEMTFQFLEEPQFNPMEKAVIEQNDHFGICLA